MGFRHCKSFFIVLQAKISEGKIDDNGESEIGEDLIHSLRDFIAKENGKTNIVKLSMIILAKLRDVYPSLKE